MTADDVKATFNEVFAEHGVVMTGGWDEPLYLPAAAAPGTDEVRYTRDHAASALHEAAHWCIAGGSRRRQVDYGYWYQPPPRDAKARRAFIAAECRVQALEWVFSDCARLPFDVSADDLAMSGADLECLRHAVAAARRDWLSAPLPTRAASFCRALENSACRRALRPAMRRHG